MTEPTRLAKRVVALTRCSRREAEQYIEGGWVSVDGVVIEKPQFMVDTQVVVIDSAATLAPLQAITLVLHKPTGYPGGDDPQAASALITPATRAADDPSGVRPLQHHLTRLTELLPLPAQASGLLIFSQDWRVVRHLGANGEQVEQEFVVEVDGTLSAADLTRLNHGLEINHYVLPPIKVSWQSEHRLRFAFKRLQPDRIEPMCQAVGLRVMGMKRLRVGRIPLARLAPGQWRYLAPDERI
ncbi:MAG: RNA pseudouridine synthase [Rhodanobacter sp.]